eukprot:scaffold101583_cov54-Phaeocystis_antarctica.AAC.1
MVRSTSDGRGDTCTARRGGTASCSRRVAASFGVEHQRVLMEADVKASLGRRGAAAAELLLQHICCNAARAGSSCRRF